MDKFEISLDIISRDGPFEEFKQDASIVTIELSSGETISNVFLLYPNKILAIKGYSKLPFKLSNIARVYQGAQDLKTRSSSNWQWFGN